MDSGVLAACYLLYKQYPAYAPNSIQMEPLLVSYSVTKVVRYTAAVNQFLRSSIRHFKAGTGCSSGMQAGLAMRGSYPILASLPIPQDALLNQEK